VAVIFGRFKPKGGFIMEQFLFEIAVALLVAVLFFFCGIAFGVRISNKKNDRRIMMMRRWLSLKNEGNARNV